MWLIALFDLPVDSISRKRAYTHFRRDLLRDGFDMLQYSVYARYCPSEEASEVHRKRVRQSVPAEGQVRILSLTDHQFGKMEIYSGLKRLRTEKRPLQLEFF